jgi:peptidoglycan L-alanyl-D-glutamate endopeptidase CwlK
MIDSISLQRANQLHPHIRQRVIASVNHINSKILTGEAKVRISYGVRTFAEQDILYAQGRTNKKLPKVTNAKGGDSIHNYALAIDIVLIINGKEASWDTKKDFDKDKQSDWMEVVQVLKQQGFTWGGDWRTFKDMPHFEDTKGLTLAEIKEKYKNKDFIIGTNFIKI